MFFLSLRVCPCTPSSHNLTVYAARDVRGRKPDLVQRDAASDGRARVGAQPKWKFHVVFVQWPGRRVFNPTTRVRSPHTTPIKSRELSRSATKPAATIGRLRNPSPEPFLVFASLTQWKSARLSSEMSPVQIRHEAPVFSTLPSGRRRRAANPVAQARVSSSLTVESSKPACAWGWP